jgi:hypothetical protein
MKVGGIYLRLALFIEDLWYLLETDGIFGDRWYFVKAGGISWRLMVFI